MIATATMIIMCLLLSGPSNVATTLFLSEVLLGSSTRMAFLPIAIELTDCHRDNSSRRVTRVNAD